MDLERRYLGNTAYFFPSAAAGHFLLGLLNSNLFFTYAKKVFVEKQGGWFEFEPDGLEAFPIPVVLTEKQKPVERLVEQILSAKQRDADADVSALEREIDELVYALYAYDQGRKRHRERCCEMKRDMNLIRVLLLETEGEEPKPDLSDYTEEQRVYHSALLIEAEAIEEPIDDFSFHATLFEYPLLRTAPGSEVKGETDIFEYVLTKDEATSDLYIALYSKKGCPSAGKDKDWIKFDAFMNALAFANGIHAWPYRIEYCQAGQKFTDRVTTAHKLRRSTHSPFTERLAFNAQTGDLVWNFQDAIRCAATFFEKDTPLSKEVAIILFLFREADDGVHSEITTIALCALFENLVRLLFRELNMKKTSDQTNVEFFEQAKTELADYIQPKISDKGDGYRRLLNVVRSAHLYSIEQMFQALVTHFGLQWQDDMENIYKTWSRARNPLVHDKARAETTEDKLKESVKHESKIAGAINILLLKLFGYSGWLRHSALEDGYRQI